MRKDVLDLINRQKAEIERLKEGCEETADRLSRLLWYATDGKLSKSNYTMEAMKSAVDDCTNEYCEEAKAEAIKEFAEKIKKHCTSIELNAYMDSVLEEMVGERE